MVDWFRSWHGAPTDPKWRTVARRANCRPGDVAAVVWYLLDRASQADERGSIAGYDAEVIADALGYEPEVVAAIIAAMEDKNALSDDRFVGWEKYQPKRDDGSAERGRAFRERKRTQPNAPEKSREDTEKKAAQQNAPEIEGPPSRKPMLDGIEEECRAAAGLENDPSPGLFDISPLVTLIDKGYSLSRDILPKLREAKAKNKKGATWRYYVPAIEQAKRANGSIKANERDQPAAIPTLWITTDAPEWPIFCERWRRERGKDPPATGSRKGLVGQGWHFPATYASHPHDRSTER